MHAEVHLENIVYSNEEDHRDESILFVANVLLVRS